MKALIVTLFVLTTLTTLADGKKLDIRCRGLEGYSISVEYNVDAGGGWIKSKNGYFAVGIDLGPMIEQRVPEQRRTGLTHLQVEQIGGATLRHAFDEKKQALVATIIGAPIGSVTNLIALPLDPKRFLAIARTLARAPCTRTPR